MVSGFAFPQTTALRFEFSKRGSRRSNVPRLSEFSAEDYGFDPAVFKTGGLPFRAVAFHAIPGSHLDGCDLQLLLLIKALGIAYTRVAVGRFDSFHQRGIIDDHGRLER
jgi:hypothetical protein